MAEPALEEIIAGRESEYDAFIDWIDATYDFVSWAKTVANVMFQFKVGLYNTWVDLGEPVGAAELTPEEQQAELLRVFEESGYIPQSMSPDTPLIDIDPQLEWQLIEYDPDTGLALDDPRWVLDEPETEEEIESLAGFGLVWRDEGEFGAGYYTIDDEFAGATYEEALAWAQTPREEDPGPAGVPQDSIWVAPDLYLPPVFEDTEGNVITESKYVRASGVEVPENIALAEVEAYMGGLTPEEPLGLQEQAMAEMGVFQNEQGEYVNEFGNVIGKTAAEAENWIRHRQEWKDFIDRQITPYQQATLGLERERLAQAERPSLGEITQAKVWEQQQWMSQWVAPIPWAERWQQAQATQGGGNAPI